jgi:hypothetical protein
MVSDDSPLPGSRDEVLRGSAVALYVEASGGALGCQVASLYRLPSARVRTAVDVQHLSGDVTSFRQVNDGIGNVLCF